MPFRIPFAGEGEFFISDSVLSHCYGALLPMFDTEEATTLRQLCKEFKNTVADFPWEDERTVIRGSVAGWRVCFPRARWANVAQAPWVKGHRKTPLVNADFVHFVGVRRLNMKGSSSITDAAFAHLKGIHTLNMAACYQNTITDAAFAHLKGIHTLRMMSCNQPTITDAAFVHLQGIHTLEMGGCDQITITDAAFVHLKGIHTLNMIFCNQPTITVAAFAHLKGIHTLSLFLCTQLTNAVFTHLKGIKRLDIGDCTQFNLTDDSLKGIEWLGMYGHSHAQVAQAKSLGYSVD
jgi:hypothetical protein